MATLGSGGCVKWTDHGGATHTLNLEWGLEIQPGGVTAGHDKRRFIKRSLDKTVREVTYIEPGVSVIVAQIRFQELPQSLIDMLKIAADGEDVTWEPTCGGTPSYTVQVENAAEAVDQVKGDADLFHGGRYETPPLRLYQPGGGDFSEVL